MRHLSPLIVAMFVAPWSGPLIAAGPGRSAQAARAVDTGDLVRAAICLGGAGLLLALLATLRRRRRRPAADEPVWRVAPEPAQRRPQPPRHRPEPAQPEPAQHNPEPAQPEPAKLEPAKPEPAMPEPAQHNPEPAQGGPSAGELPHLSRPAPAPALAPVPVPATEPAPAIRRAGSPRSGNGFPSSAGSGKNNTDRRPGGRRSEVPRRGQPEARGQANGRT